MKLGRQTWKKLFPIYFLNKAPNLLSYTCTQSQLLFLSGLLKNRMHNVYFPNVYILQIYYFLESWFCQHDSCTVQQQGSKQPPPSGLLAAMASALSTHALTSTHNRVPLCKYGTNPTYGVKYGAIHRLEKEMVWTIRGRSRMTSVRQGGGGGKPNTDFC